MSDLYKRTLETIQILVVIGGFWITMANLNKLQESTDHGSYNSVSGEWMKVDTYFRDHPDMRKYFYDAAPIPAEEKHRLKVEAVAHYVLNFADYAIATSSRMLIDDDVWRTYVLMTYFKSPAVCASLEKLQKGYSPTARQLAAEMCP